MKRRLSVEQYYITILKMPFDDVSDLDFLSNLFPVGILQENLSSVGQLNIVSTRMDVRTISDMLLHLLQVVLVNSLRVCKILCNQQWDDDFVDCAVGIG